MDIGALSLLISEKGFADVMQKVAAVDTAAAKIGAKPTAVQFTAPQISTVTQGLAKVQQTVSAISGTPATVRFNVGQVQQATAALGQATQASEQAATAVQKAGQASATSGNAVQAMTPKVRSAANGLVALAFAATATTPNFQSMALAVGLVTTSLAEAFGAGKIAQYATGIGALLSLAAAAVGIYQRMAAATDAAANAQRRIGSAPDLESAQRRYAQLTNTLEGLRREQEKLAGKSLFSTTIAEAFRLQQLGNEITAFEKAQQAAFEGLKDRERDQARAIATATRDAAIAAAQSRASVLAAALDSDDARNKAAFDRGLRSLSEYYQKRSEIIQARTQSEIRALEAERGRLSVAPTGEQPDERIARLQRVKDLEDEISAARLKGGAQQQANAGEQLAAQRSLAQQIIGFQRQIAEAQGNTHAARLVQINEEADAFRRALTQQLGPGAANAINAQVDAFRNALTAAEDYRAKQDEIRLALDRLATERQRIETAVAGGQLNEAQGAEKIAELERARIPLLQQLQRELLKLAIASQNPQAIADAEKLNAELDALGKNVELASFKRGLAQRVTDAISGAISGGVAAAVRSGSIADGFKALGGSFLSALGGLLITIGERTLAASTLIQGIVTALAALSPGAAIAGSLALIALGGVLQGLGARVSSGGSGGGGSASGARSLSPSIAAIPVSRVTLDPDRRLHEPAAATSRPVIATNQRAALAPIANTFHMNFFGTPNAAAERFVAAAARGADGRGIAITRRRRS